MAAMEDVKMDLSKFDGHTPGPWSFAMGYSGHQGIFAEDGTYVFGVAARADKHPEWKAREANHRLVLAAPSLLHQVSVLKEALEMIADLTATQKNAVGASLNAIANEALEDARTVLSAQGEMT